MRLVSKSNLRIWGIPLLRPSFSFFETNRLRDEVERRGGGRREEGLYCSLPPSLFSISYFCLTTTFGETGSGGGGRRLCEAIKVLISLPPALSFPFSGSKNVREKQQQLGKAIMKEGEMVVVSLFRRRRRRHLVSHSREGETGAEEGGPLRDRCCIAR